jgi:AcrR family transcriptional regulator
VARPKRQDERRAQLVAATASAIADRGLSDLRLKHIADEAGLSVGSVLYYYPDLDALLVEVHQQVLDQFYVARVDALAAEIDPAAQLRLLVEQGIRAEPETTMRAIYELHVAAARDESHAALLTRLWESEVSLYESVLRRGADDRVFTLRDDARAIAETVVALEDAFDLHLTGRNAAIDRDLAVRRCLAYLATMTGTRLLP